ncbi:MAG TPA: STAS domain-containing protein [Candidatus Baltobacteraceae bacterium]|nr:STAS domain-containing protein [Candidatus Baltobacteraceae bacterium]
MDQNERAATVAFSGDLDVYRRDEIASALPHPGSIDHVVIDMREAAILDSSIVAVLMRYRRQFIEAGGNPLNIVVVVPKTLRRIFEITGLVSLMTVVTASLDDEPTRL